MSLHTIVLVMIGLSVPGTAAIGLRVSRRGIKDLNSGFVGAKSLPWYLPGVWLSEGAVAGEGWGRCTLATEAGADGGSRPFECSTSRLPLGRQDLRIGLGDDARLGQVELTCD